MQSDYNIIPNLDAQCSEYSKTSKKSYVCFPDKTLLQKVHLNILGYEK